MHLAQAPATIPQPLSPSSAPLPRPHWRLLRTLLKWPRNVRQFAPALDTKAIVANPPDLAETAHWGQVSLLEDLLVALHRDGTTTRLTHGITAPHSDESLANWDEFSRVYDPRRTRYTARLARIHLPDGTRRPARSYPANWGPAQHGFKLVYTPLRPGVLVELDLQADEFQPDEVGPALWEHFLLQTQFPCRRRRITLAVAEPFAARIELHHGAQAPQESFEKGYRVYRWDLHDVPGIEADAFTPPPLDFAPWVDISTLPGWQQVATAYRKELTLAPAAKPAVQKLAQELAASASTDRERAFAIYRYAARDMRYGRHPSELDVPTIRNASEMLEDLRGDCKDKSSLMIALLAEHRIPAQMAVLLTAVNGRTPLLPGRRFDHAVVAATIEGRETWFDPAAGFYTYGQIPQNDQGVQALLLDGQAAHAHAEPRFTDVPTDAPAEQLVTRTCRGELTAEGDYMLQVDVTARGERAAVYRSMFTDRSDDHRRRTIEQGVADERPGARVTEIVLGDVADLDADIHYRYRLHLSAWARPVQDLLLLRLPWTEPMEVSGPISAPQRELPLQVPGALRLVEVHEIALPPGYAGYALPVNLQYETTWASYSLTITCDGNRLLCQRQTETRGGIVPPAQFAEFKSFWESSARADTLDIVLVRGATIGSPSSPSPPGRGLG